MSQLLLLAQQKIKQNVVLVASYSENLFLNIFSFYVGHRKHLEISKNILEQAKFEII